MNRSALRLRSLLVVATVTVSCLGLGAPAARAATYSVALSASPTTLETTEATTLTTTADRDLSGSAYTTYLWDQSDPGWYRRCKVATCSFQVAQSAPGTRSYIAYVARDVANPTYPPSGIRARSNPVSVTWTPSSFTVSLSADPSWLPPGSTATLSAATNRDVGGRGLSIQIFDLTSGQRLAECSAGTTCWANVSELSPATRTYRAFVAQPSTTAPPPGIQASSEIVTVTWSVLPDPTRPPNAGGGPVTGTVDFDGAGVPPAGQTCAATSFAFAGSSQSAWVNGSGTAYAGPLDISGEGGSSCETVSTGNGTVTLHASGTSALGSLSCSRLDGAFTRVGTDVTVVVSGDCLVNGFPATRLSFVAQGEFVPTNDGGGVSAPVTSAAFAGAFVVVPT